ncbi:hypothetical protein BJX68DRAFT_235448 [Aspergillus pseudodeflectus]|uniref:Uncharacterized protein n=1 Tax=Aspergillus pseudodeflectus TaxID=176178 RepID=A0ABR4KH84_9EURO
MGSRPQKEICCAEAVLMGQAALAGTHGAWRIARQIVICLGRSRRRQLIDTRRSQAKQASELSCCNDCICSFEAALR